MRRAIVNIVPLSVVTVVTLAIELCTIGVGNVRLELTIRMVVLGAMDHLPTTVAGMGGSRWSLHGWAPLRLIFETAVAITALTIATTTTTRLLQMGRGLQ